MIEKQTVSVEDSSAKTLSRRELGRKRLEKIISEEKKMVRGIFKNHECPDGSILVSQKKYKELPAFHQTLTDGQEYELPLWVARWINGIDKCAEELNGRINSCRYPIHKHLLDSSGNPHVGVGQWRERYSFQSLEFS